MSERISGYTYQEFLNTATAIAKGQAPIICGRRMNRQQHLIVDTLAAYHQDQALLFGRYDLSEKWNNYRDVVLMTRLDPMDRNEIYNSKLEENVSGKKV